jgi:hypothetical protein
VSLSRPQRADLASLSVAGTIAGRAFSTASILRSSSETITDRTVMLCERYAHLTAMLIATKAAYGDTFKVTRRQQPMTIASGLLWQLAPPLVFATDRLVLAGMLEPCYDNAATRWTTSSTTASSTSASSTPLATAWRRPASPRSPLGLPAQPPSRLRAPGNLRCDGPRGR